jgi:hypothetical protein
MAKIVELDVIVISFADAVDVDFCAYALPILLNLSSLSSLKKTPELIIDNVATIETSNNIKFL